MDSVRARSITPVLDAVIALGADGTVLEFSPAAEALFVPEGEERTSAELSDEEKDAASHRGRAFRALGPTIDDLLDDGRLGPG